MASIPEQSLKQRKARDRAIILPLVGLLLLTPPLAKIFSFEGTLLGLPFIWLYVFAVWAALIAGAAWLSSHLAEDGDLPGSPDGGRQDGGRQDADGAQEP